MGKINGEFLARMEAILNRYNSPCPDNTLRISFDERPCQLIEDVYAPIPTKPGKPRKYDGEYKRNGSACLMMAYYYDKGIRYHEVRKRRTKRDFAQFFDNLEKQHPEVNQILVTLDNLNTHGYGSFYENLPLERAAFLSEKIKFQFTPKHASWLNMIEIEFAALVKQCLKTRIGSLHRLDKEITAWVKDRNKKRTKILWSFTTPKARVTMASFYIKISPNF